MGNDLVVALVSGAVSLTAFLIVFHFLNRIFNIEMPDYIGFLLGIAAALTLYIRRDFFFQRSPLIAGITIGFILALLWDLKDTGFIASLLRTVISFRFLLWIGATALGIINRADVMDVWDRYVVQAGSKLEPYLLFLSIIIYFAGTVFVLFPEFYVNWTMRGEGFSMVKKVPKSTKIYTQIAGLLMVGISSTMLNEVVKYIYKLFNIGG